MSTKVVLKLAALLTALTLTVVAITWLKQGHMNSFWTSLGFQTGDRLNWCLERVSSFYHFESGAKLLEKDGKWLWQSADKSQRELDYLRVEKWFARYCQVPYEDLPPVVVGDIAKTEPVAEVAFLDEQRTTIFRLVDQDDGFAIQDKMFKSETLRKAIEELLAFDRKIQ